MANFWFVSVFIFYLGFVLLIWLWAGKRIKNTEDFYVAGRDMPWYAVLGSLLGTALTGAILTGTTATIGQVGHAWMWITLGVSMAFAFQIFIGVKLRKFGQFTVADFIHQRFPDKRLTILVVLILGLLMAGYTGTSMIAGGLMIQTIFGVPYAVGALIMGLFVIAYTIHGGMMSVIWTDVLQTVVFMSMVFVGLFYFVPLIGGFESMVVKVNEAQPGFFDWTGGGTVPLSIGIGWMVGWGLGSLVNPAILTRFYTTKNVKDSIKAGLSFVIILFVFYYALFFSVAAIKLLVPTPSDPELLWLEGFINYTHPIVAGLAAVSIVAAAMSTADSQLLSASTMISRDIYWRFLNPNASEKLLLQIVRLAVLITGAIALAIAVWRPAQIIPLVTALLSYAGGALGPVLIAALFWKRATTQGALASAITGSIVGIIFEYIPFVKAALQPIPPVVLTFILSSVVLWAVSKRTSVTQEQIDFYESVVSIKRELSG